MSRVTKMLRMQDYDRVENEVRNEPEKVLQRASGGSLTDILALASNVPHTPRAQRRGVFLVLLKFLRESDCLFDNPRKKQPEYGLLVQVLWVLLGIGQSSQFIEEDKCMAQDLSKEWPTVARWVCRFCDKFKSKTEPLPGVDVSFEEWYLPLVTTLFVAHADVKHARELWSVSDARHALFKLWLLECSDMPYRAHKMCASVVGIVMLHSCDQTLDLTSELVQQSGLGEEGLAHFAMTRLIKAAKSENVNDMRDDAYVVLALLTTSRCESLRSTLSKKKALPYLTRTFVKLANVETIHEDSKNLDYVEKFLRLFEYLTDPGGGVPCIRQALSHGFLQGIVSCGLLLDTLRHEAVDGLQNIMDFLIKHLSHYSVVLGALDALKDIEHRDIDRCIDKGMLKSKWTRFEQYVLERSAFKVLFERSIQSDTSISVCAECGRREQKEKLQKCAGCLIMHYCSRECQAKHWRHGGHRKQCKNLSHHNEGWDRRDRRFSEFITVYDVLRHWKDLHQLAVKRFGLGPVPHGKSPPYGCSIDYKTIPPTLDVFDLEEEVKGKDLEFRTSMAKHDKYKEKTEAEGHEMFLLKVTLPRGRTELTQIFHGSEDLHGLHLWERNSDALESAYGPPTRLAGVDGDGMPLGAVSDEVDGVLNKLRRAKIRVGDHFRWGSRGRREDGQTNVLEEITRVVDSDNKLESRKKIIIHIELGTNGAIGM